MTIPANLTLIREDAYKPRLLRDLRADMLAVETDYLMVVGLRDQVVIEEPLVLGVHYLPTHVATRRAFRYSRPVLPYDPLLLTQFNYMGSPILHRDLAPLFPEAAEEPWHLALVRAQLQGAQMGLLAGSHTVVEPWPRPELSGAYGQYRASLDPDAIMEAVPGIQARVVNYRPYFSLKTPYAASVYAYCRNCTQEFIDSLVGHNVTIVVTSGQNLSQMQTSNAEYVAWFDGMAEAANGDTLSQLHIALQFPGVSVASPRLVADFTPGSIHRPISGLTGGIHSGFSNAAWMSRTQDLLTIPASGCTTSHAILREVP